MNTNIKLHTYHTVIEDVFKEYVTGNEFIRNKLNELCSEHDMSSEEVC